MIILRNDLFSEKGDKEKKEKRERKRVKLAATGFVLGNTVLGVKLLNNAKNYKESEESKRVIDRLKESHKKSVNIVDDIDMDGSEFDAYQSKSKNNDLLPFKVKDRNNPTVYLGKHNRKNPATLAHELGHSDFSEDTSPKGLGRLTYKVDQHTRGRKWGTLVGLGTGIAAAKREHEGKEDSKLLKHAGSIVSGVSSIPTISQEILASKRGIEKLREAGASEKMIKDSKKNLAMAAGTYITNAAFKAAGARLAHEGGKWLGRKYYKHKEQEEKYDDID